jgi:hypothetical protein
MILQRTDRYSGHCSTCLGRVRRRCTHLLAAFAHVLDPHGEDQLGDEIRAGLIALINALHAEKCRQRGWLFSFLALEFIHVMTYDLYLNRSTLILRSRPLAL